MSNQIRLWYEFTLAQMASESYLDDIEAPEFDITNEQDVRVRLENGSNHYDVVATLPPDQVGATRMTTVMINDFNNT